MPKYDVHDAHFRTFATSLNVAIKKNGERDTKAFLKYQKNQVETLVKLEKELRKELIASKFGNVSYKRFVEYICDEKRNILYARPFFRERQAAFTKRISKALKTRNIEKMKKFHFNFQFIKFVMNSRKWSPKSPISILYEKVNEVRDRLVVMNMPLAISRARIFYSRTPPSQLSYMDLVQTSAEGLLSAVDKFVLPFSKVFRSVAIGRCVGNLIFSYSETLIHFYPREKKILYRANKRIGRLGGENVDYQELSDNVNDGLTLNQSTTPDKVADLMAAASTVSADTPATIDPDLADSISRFSAPESTRPDIIVEERDLMNHLGLAMKNLSIKERKCLILLGVSV
jgi:DNA-directed RNA polymerase specialized sigma subunit